MNYPIIVRHKTKNKFIAEPLGKPELRVAATTEKEALEGVGKALESWLGSAKLVQIDVPIRNSPTSPWIEGFGRSEDDPDFDEFLAEMDKARATLDSRP